jgi:hypothetical protein
MKEQFQGNCKELTPQGKNIVKVCSSTQGEQKYQSYERDQKEKCEFTILATAREVVERTKPLSDGTYPNDQEQDPENDSRTNLAGPRRASMISSFIAQGSRRFAPLLLLLEYSSGTAEGKLPLFYSGPSLIVPYRFTSVMVMHGPPWTTRGNGEDKSAQM